jgi:hypothetical protein
LRSCGGYLRALSAFDPKRRAILLLGGGERGDWTGWYERNIPIADDPTTDTCATSTTKTEPRPARSTASARLNIRSGRHLPDHECHDANSSPASGARSR